MLPAIALRHVSSKASNADGLRVLVDRRWPPGLRKEDVDADLWLKELGPSDPLLRWYRRDATGRWREFARRYRRELAGQADLVLLLAELWNRGPITLLHCGRDAEHDPAAVVCELLEERVLLARTSSQ